MAESRKARAQTEDTPSRGGKQALHYGPSTQLLWGRETNSVSLGQITKQPSHPHLRPSASFPILGPNTEASEEATDPPLLSGCQVSRP